MDALAALLAAEGDAILGLAQAAKKAGERETDWLCESCMVIVRAVRCIHCGKSEEERK